MAIFQLFIILKQIKRNPKRVLTVPTRHSEEINEEISLNAFQQLIQKILNISSHDKMKIKVQLGDQFKSIRNDKKWNEIIPKLQQSAGPKGTLDFKIKVRVEHKDEDEYGCKFVISQQVTPQHAKEDIKIGGGSVSEEKVNEKVEIMTQQDKSEPTTQAVTVQTLNEKESSEPKAPLDGETIRETLLQLKEEITEMKNQLQMKKQEFKSLKSQLKKRRVLNVPSIENTSTVDPIKETNEVSLSMVETRKKRKQKSGNPNKTVGHTQQGDLKKKLKEERIQEQQKKKMERENLKNFKKELKLKKVQLREFKRSQRSRDPSIKTNHFSTQH